MGECKCAACGGILDGSQSIDYIDEDTTRHAFTVDCVKELVTRITALEAVIAQIGGEDG